MEESSATSQQVSIHIGATNLNVAPGSSTTVPVYLVNTSPEDGQFELTVTGIASHWVSLPTPVIHLVSGVQYETLLTIQPPLPPEGRAGRYQVLVRAMNQQRPQQAAEATCTLTVAALVVPDRIGILLASSEYPVALGESVAVPLVLLNQGLESDVVSLSVEGIPISWVTASAASMPLLPGQQHEVTLTIQPVASEAGRAGQHPFKILVVSQADPTQVPTAECILTIAASSQFNSELSPKRVEAGNPVWLTVDNQSNVPQAFNLNLESPGDTLDFEPTASQILHIPPTEVSRVEYRPKQRSRPLFGKERVLPFTARVQAAEGEAQNLNGEVVGKALIPTWLAIAALVALLVCTCLSVLAAIYVGSQAGATPTATAWAPSEVPTAESTATALPVSGDLWQQIQASGKIIVGTSADYPPFEFYTDANQIDGFDIAMMDEIGRRLGIQVEYRDYVFDGLGPALRLGEIQVALAAISRTPERESVSDFSNVYLVSEDGVLAHESSNLVIGSIDDAAQYRIGVQRNSVYQDWIQVVLLDSGRMSPDNLFAYDTAQNAVRDLQSQRIDLVFLDAQAAQAYAEQGGVKLIAKGLNPQNYAIAMPKGQSSLKAELDQAITELYNDGTIGTLAKRYLGLPQVLPTPTPGPTSTAAPAPECENGLLFVQDLGQPGEVSPGQAFAKGWQVQNTGTCTWNTGYRLAYADGSDMGGEPVAVSRNVAPGETYDFQVNLTAPLYPGDYQSFWQLFSDQGTAFGERLQVNVRVIAGPTVTPQPTQTPVAGIFFTVDRNTIKAGECVNFAWKVENVKEVYFYRDGESWQDNGVAGEGTQVECPPVTSTYYLGVVMLDESVEVREITISVEPVAGAPQIIRFTVDPPGQITLGQCVTLRWQVEGELDRVLLTANDVVLWDGAPVSGSYQDCPAASGVVAYGLEATGPGGTSRGQQNINVVDTATATPEATAAPELPVIYSFVVDPAQIVAGECVGISWSLGGGTSYSRIQRNGVILIDDAGYSGQQTDCLDTMGEYTYQVSAYSATGEEVTQEQLVSVSEASD